MEEAGHDSTRLCCVLRNLGTQTLFTKTPDLKDNGANCHMQGLALEPIELTSASTRQPSQHSVRPPKQNQQQADLPGSSPRLVSPGCLPLAQTVGSMKPTEASFPGVVSLARSLSSRVAPRG